MNQPGASSGAVTLTREQLYERIWQTPMTRLAAGFGLSDNGLRKICRKLNIPFPPAGWWAKHAAGKRVSRTPLPVLRQGVPNQATITPSPKPTDASGLRDAIRREAERLGTIAIAERLVRPHPLIAGWIADHRDRQKEARRQRRTWPYSNWTVPDFTESDRRRHRLLNALFRTLGKRGAGISENDRKHLFVEICGEKIEFSCHEKSRQITRPVTAEEKRWETWNRSGVKKALEPTGRFEFQIRAWTGDSIRKLWLETDRQSFEEMLPEIAAAFLVLGPVLAERTGQREEEARVQAERQRQLELERQRKDQDDKRWRRFLWIAEGWRSSELAREFIVRLKQLDLPESEPIDGKSLAEWVDWAEAKARELDPVDQGIERIFADVGRIQPCSQVD